jgi:hypothetical protein
MATYLKEHAAHSPSREWIGHTAEPILEWWAEKTLAGLPIKLVGANYCDLPEVLSQLQLPPVDGLLLHVPAVAFGIPLIMP